MSDRVEPHFGRQDQPEGRDVPLLLGPNGGKETQAAGTTRPLPLPALIAPKPWADFSDPRRKAEPEPSRKRIGPPLAWIGSAVASFLLAGVALWIVDERRGQAAMVAEGAQATTALARTVEALGARLSAIENAKPDDQLTELRRSIADIRSTLASSHALGGALAELSQRVEKLGRDESAKVDQLGERVDHETSAKTAELAQRIETLEKKATVATAAAAETSTQPLAKQPPAPAKLANVETEPTGSIERPRPVLRGYIVLGARDDIAVLEGRYGELAVRPGDFLPGAGKVQRIARQRGGWVVVTEQGLIPSGYSAY
ncbi:MAG: hypothetical protein JO288_21780 [Hyphomicrobiales bacterium]|nr:hypothetical protein [Hyphomicrobiales bacterium]